MDSYVGAINALGMTAILNPYEGNVGAKDLVKAGDTACYSYGQFLGDRFKHADVIWHLGNDLQVTSSAIFHSFQNVARGILAADPNHLMTIELFDTPRGGSGFSTSFDNEGGYGSFGSVFGSKGINGAYTYGPTYGYTGVAYNGSGTSFRRVAGTNLTSPCPVILLEANYPGENLSRRRVDGDHLSQAAVVAHSCGRPRRLYLRDSVDLEFSVGVATPYDRRRLGRPDVARIP